VTSSNASQLNTGSRGAETRAAACRCRTDAICSPEFEARLSALRCAYLQRLMPVRQSRNRVSMLGGTSLVSRHPLGSSVRSLPWKSARITFLSPLPRVGSA